MTIPTQNIFAGGREADKWSARTVPVGAGTYRGGGVRC